MVGKSSRNSNQDSNQYKVDRIIDDESLTIDEVKSMPFKQK